MTRTLRLFLVGAVVLLSQGVGRTGDICPSTAPKCTSSGPKTVARLIGAFACTGTIIAKGSSSQPNPETAEVLEGTADGKGHITGKEAETSTISNTFKDFQSHTATYCLNEDGTGYIFPVGGCPLAFAIADSADEAQALGTAAQQAFTIVCRKQLSGAGGDIKN